MPDTVFKEPKERILDSASKLFAQRGFSAIGVREIAKDADVNISMVSYYFNGKTGILKAIIDEYFNEVKQILNSISEKSYDPATSLKYLLKEMISLFNKRQDLCKVAIIELPFDQEDVADFKVKMFDEHIKLIKQTFHAHGNFFDKPEQTMIIGPAFLSLLFSNLIFGNVIKDSSNITFDDAYYEQYIEIISTLFLKGIIGVATSNKMKEGGMPSGHPHAEMGHPHAGGHPAGIPKGHQDMQSGHPHSAMGHPHAGAHPTGIPAGNPHTAKSTANTKHPLAHKYEMALGKSSVESTSTTDKHLVAISTDSAEFAPPNEALEEQIQPNFNMYRAVHTHPKTKDSKFHYNNATKEYPKKYRVSGSAQKPPQQAPQYTPKDTKPVPHKPRIIEDSPFTQPHPHAHFKKKKD